MTMVTVELLLVGLIVVVVALLAGLAWVTPRRQLRGSITEAQARENAAPLTAAILASDRRERTGP
jgi:hypothetical protein